MPETPKYLIPYPTENDQADGPVQFQALATRVETILSTGTLDLTAGALKVRTPAAVDHATPKSYVDDQIGTVNARLVIGPAASVPATAPDGTIYFGY
jgi:hypothetical protein